MATLHQDEYDLIGKSLPGQAGETESFRTSADGSVTIQTIDCKLWK